MFTSLVYPNVFGTSSAAIKMPIKNLFINIMANQCENFCGRGRARGSKVKNLGGAGGCGGQISIILRVRAVRNT